MRDLAETDTPQTVTLDAEPAVEAVEGNFGSQASEMTTAPGSDTESFEEVSESDLAALAALSVGGVSARQLLQPEADQVSPMVCSCFNFLYKYCLKLILRKNVA